MSGCRDEAETCNVFWGSSGCDLPRGHDEQRAVRPHRRERDSTTVTIHTAYLYGEDLTAEELRLRAELYGEDDDPPVQCWHTEPGTPCDWNICRQPERLAAGDRGTDPASVAVDPSPRPLSEHCRPGRCLALTCCSYECSQGRCPSIPEEFRKTAP